jgi:uncharacterized protein YydD (DUF2326 family)
MSSVAREGLWTSGAESLRILKTAGIGEDEEMVCEKTGAPKKNIQAMVHRNHRE